MQNAIKHLWAFFLFTFPFSIRFLIYEGDSYRFGNFNPWVSEFIYLPEVLLILIFILWSVDKFKKKNYQLKFHTKWLWILLLLFAVNAYFVTLLNGDGILGAFFLLRIFEALIVFWLITETVLPLKQVVSVLLLGSLFQVVWGYAQWNLNHSLGSTLLP